MSSGPVLITGVTGLVGFQTLIFALKAGYQIRAAVRSQAKADSVLSNHAIKALALPSSQLSFIIVPDITAPGAYDEAVKGAKYVIHIASPLVQGIAPEEFESRLITPAVQGTVEMLESAKKAGSVKRIVITASIASLVTAEELFSGGDEIIGPTRRVPNREGPFDTEFVAYGASKIKAFNESEKWIAQEKPAFDVVNLHPSFVIGRNDYASTPEELMAGSNGFALGPILGEDGPHPVAGNTVHNDDVARAHVQGLDPKIPAGSYLLSWNPEGTFDGTEWQDATEIATRLFKKAVEQGILKNIGKITSIRGRKYDSSKTEQVFGFKLQGYEEQIKSVVERYLELVAKN